MRSNWNLKSHNLPTPPCHPRIPILCELLLYSIQAAGDCLDPIGPHCLELHIRMGCGSQSNSKFRATSLSFSAQLFPSQATAKIASSRHFQGPVTRLAKPLPSFSLILLLNNSVIKNCYPSGISSPSQQLGCIYV